MKCVQSVVCKFEHCTVALMSVRMLSRMVSSVGGPSLVSVFLFKTCDDSHALISDISCLDGNAVIDAMNHEIVDFPCYCIDHVPFVVGNVNLHRFSIGGGGARCNVPR